MHAVSYILLSEISNPNLWSGEISRATRLEILQISKNITNISFAESHSIKMVFKLTCFYMNQTGTFRKSFPRSLHPLVRSLCASVCVRTFKNISFLKPLSSLSKVVRFPNCNLRPYEWIQDPASTPALLYMQPVSVSTAQ